MNSNTRVSGCLMLAAGIALGLSAGAARAQCDVYRLGLPDFDQRRSVLPNGGNAYCVTTCGMNQLAYIANHGFPAMLDGPRGWQSQSNYGYVSAALALMGLPGMMNTDPSDGTTWGGFRNGMQAWMDTFYPDAFVVSVAGPNGQWVPTPNILAFLEASNCLVSIAHGRYTLDTCGPDPTQYRRTGGHCVTLARVYDACSASPQVWYRDPAGLDGDNLTQAQFVTQKSDYTLLAGSYNGSDECIPNPVARSMWRRLDPDPSVRSILDGYGYTVALEGLTADAKLGTVSVMGTWDLDELTVPARRTLGLPAGHAVVGLAYEVAAPSPIVLSEDVDGRDFLVWQRGSSPSAPLVPIATFSQPMSHLVTGLRDDIYMWQQLTPTAGRVVRFDLGRREIVGSLVLPAAPRAMAYDDEADQLMVVTGDAGSVGRCGPELEEYGATPLPSAMPPLVGEVSICRTTGRIDGAGFAVCGDGANGIYLLRHNRDGSNSLTGRIDVPTIVHPRNLRVTPRGTVVCTSEGEVRAVEFDADRGEWRPAERFPLAGERVGRLFTMVDSRANAGDWFGTRADRNIFPPTDQADPIPACDADFNGDRVLNSQDFFDYLRAFFEGSPGADFNQNGELNSQDFFDFLAAFFAGCR